MLLRLDWRRLMRKEPSPSSKLRYAGGCTASPAAAAAAASLLLPSSLSLLLMLPLASDAAASAAANVFWFCQWYWMPVRCR